MPTWRVKISFIFFKLIWFKFFKKKTFKKMEF
jgi:hypothetical protein